MEAWLAGRFETHKAFNKSSLEAQTAKTSASGEM
eukprot:CAMPEP_0184077348 /NCGR_PEP_ID=MMETSP0974-20121125/608_1 /TAXON_ID=483370 /ORGANISM="non described non described, Strain CCMP2097" /LENGTH=33 /DNA_ID= /DNA_START= /DNA_END= /DNA_ORIENTATION=